MFDITSGPGDAGHGSFGSSDNSNGYRHGRGRLRGDDFGLTARPSLLALARTYLETQTRLWPELAGTPAVPNVTDAVVEAMADDFERRFRTQSMDIFDPAGLRRVWDAIGLGYVRFSDEGSNPRSLDQQLMNVLQRARRDGVFIPWHYVCADYAVSGTLACRRGYIVAKMLVERRSDTGVAWFIIDDLGRMNRNALESLRLGELVEATQVRLIGASDGFDSSNQQSKIMLAMMSSFNEVFIDQLKAKVHRGQTDAFNRGEIVQHPGFGYRLVDVLTPEGKPELTRKNTIKKRVEIDPEAAEWIVRGAEMIVRDNRSPGAVAVVFNDNNVGGARTWSSNRIRKLYARERLVGVEVFRRTMQVRDRDTGHVDVVQKDREAWMTRECPEMRILSDELADAVKAKLNLGSMRFGKNAAELRRDGKDPGRRVDVYPTVLVRPVCGGCGKPMALSRSTGKYKSFVCLNSIHGGHGCRNKGNKSARIIDEAVLKVVSAQILDEGFITDLTAEVNIRLAEAARRPQDTAKKLEQEIASRQRQVGRLTERLEKVQDAGGLDTIFNKVAELNRQLEAKRAELKEEQRRNRRPSVTSVKEQDVVVALTQLREVLLSDVGRAAPVLQALVGDVVIESRQVEGRKRPEMVAKFTIDGIPALAALDRGKAAGDDDPTVGMWEFLNTDRWIMLGTAPRGRRDVVVPLRRTPKYEAMLPQIVEMAEAGAGIDLISRALGIGAEVVRDALHLHETGQRPPGRVDGRRRQRRQSGQPFEPKYRQIAVEVDRRRKAGEGFDRLAREMKVSRGTVLRAYDFANRDEPAAAAREGRKPTRPPYKWSDESRAAKRKSRGA
ncbi:MAG: recombinase family protein [Planctomycetia bacterium]|nr:recombinase family protein [Planctomycetia bacterium]